MGDYRSDYIWNGSKAHQERAPDVPRDVSPPGAEPTPFYMEEDMDDARIDEVDERRLWERLSTLTQNSNSHRQHHFTRMVWLEITMNSDVGFTTFT